MNERELKRAFQRALQGAVINLEWLKVKIWAAILGTMWLLLMIEMISYYIGKVFEIDFRIFILPLILFVIALLKWVKSLIYNHLHMQIDNWSLYAMFIIFTMASTLIFALMFAGTRTLP